MTWKLRPAPCSKADRFAAGDWRLGKALAQFIRAQCKQDKSQSRKPASEMNKSLTHINPDGTARMVDVGAKAETQRLAIASGRITMTPEALEAIRAGNAPKGDVLGTARIAGIMAGKKTGDLIPMCHPLAIDAINLDFSFENDGLRATATVSLTGKTGVEMEAITAVSVALVTIYDMAKALDKGMVIGEIRLIEKRGGKSGIWRAGDPS
jgi:cyclic pyranopterin phosphate synthase